MSYDEHFDWGDYSWINMICFVRLCKINVKNDVYKNGYRRRSFTSETAKNHRFVRFVMYCSITSVPVAFYWACSDLKKVVDFFEEKSASG